MGTPIKPTDALADCLFAARDAVERSAPVLESVHAGELTLVRAIETLTSGPVRALNLERFVPGIGSLGLGAPADAVLFDPDTSVPEMAEHFHGWLKSGDR